MTEKFVFCFFLCHTPGSGDAEGAARYASAALPGAAMASRVLRLGLEVALGAGVYFAALAALMPEAAAAFRARLARRLRRR